MRASLFFVLLLLTACAPSTESLIQEASRSDDWTAVHQRWDAEERRDQYQSRSCPAGHTNWCSDKGGESECACIADEVGRQEYKRLFEQQERMFPRHTTTD